MNRFLKDMLMSKYSRNRDERNPYGSRGGYVVSSRGRRDRAGDDYARRDYNDYGGDYGDYRGDRRGGDMRGRDYADYADYGDYGDMRGRGGRDYRDYDDYDRDGHKEEYGVLSEKDIHNWKKSLMNNDGTKGEHFRKEQILPLIKQMGIDVHKLGGEDLFCLAMNIMYSDYCRSAKEYGVDKPDFYAKMAKDFLNDKDFEGKPEEKLWLYYKCIAEQDD